MSVYNCGEEKKSVCDTPIKAKNQMTNYSSVKNLLAGIDRDTLLVAAVMLLMLKNGGDIRLILALGYIIIGGDFGK
ncbi:MAG: hypothetical protein J6A57_02615 [Ruminococcus sp.]|nr:hypothetical protein [Ruminococcus sp.]MBQ9139752.1 hypothetical protein [Ruminococcus sp.]